VKNKSLVLAVAAISFSILFSFLSCKKVNEATDLGGDLIPSVDNINTFEVSLPAETDNIGLLNDTTRFLYQDVAALGYMNDPEFGTTKADIHFSISSKVYTTYPFIKKDQLVIDSVVLSLAYVGGYGDTANTTQTLSVYEIDPSVSVHDSVFRYTDNELPVTGAQLGTKTFALTSLKDSLTLIRKKDTTKVANVVRIRLDNSLGTKLASYDTIKGANGGYYSDSIFQTLFKGLAVKTNTTGNALSYYNLFNDAKTNLTVYYRTTNNSVIDTSFATFYHAPLYENGTLRAYGIANTVKRTPASNWQTYLTNAMPLDDKLYIQSAPGSYAGIKIPGLDNLSNRTIHLAELIIYKIPSALDNIFKPSALYLDKINNAKDSAFIFERDQSVNTQGQVTYNGGSLKNDNTYRFNITRHVQGIVTRQEPNMLLRLYAPLWSTLNVKNTTGKVIVPVIDKIASGRVVLAGGNYSDPNMRLKLRIVYSNL
jgi:hypothetical protein